MPESLEFQREENSLLPRRHMDVKWWMKHTAVLELNHWIREKRLRCFPGGWCQSSICVAFFKNDFMQTNQTAGQKNKVIQGPVLFTG